MNELTKGLNLLNNAKKMVKKINEKLPKTYIAFSNIINTKDRKDIDKKLKGPIKVWRTIVDKRTSIIFKMQILVKIV